MLFAAIAVYTQPKTRDRNPFVDFYQGRVQEIRFFNDRLDLKMTFYVVSSTMLGINAMSGAAWHYEQFSPTNEVNLGVFLYAAIFTFYVFDDHIFERVPALHLRPHPRAHGLQDVLGRHHRLRLALHPPPVRPGRLPRPRLLDRLGPTSGFIGASALFLVGWGIARGANIQKYTFKRWPRTQVPGGSSSPATSRPATARF